MVSAPAAACGLSPPFEVEASEGVIRGNVDSLMKLIAAWRPRVSELIGEGAVSERGDAGFG
jgi:hypothetical protein